jgi:hypothetical protein
MGSVQGGSEGVGREKERTLSAKRIEVHHLYTYKDILMKY